MEKKILIFLIVLIVLTGLSNWFLLKVQDQKNLVGEQAPNFVVADLQGKTFSLQEVLGKKVILLNFWATWCPPCRDEVPLLNELQRQIGSDSFVILGLMEEDSDRVEDFQKSYEHFTKEIPVRFSVYIDRGGHVANHYGTLLLPESYLIGLDGRVAHYQAGPLVKGEFPDYLQRVQALLPSGSFMNRP